MKWLKKSLKNFAYRPNDMGIREMEKVKNERTDDGKDMYRYYIDLETDLGSKKQTR